MNTCLSPKKTCGISPLKHQASGILEYSLPLEISFSPLILSLFFSLMISFDVISLSPFDINFQEGSSGICRKGLVLEIQHKTMDKTVMLVEDKIHRVELDQKRYGISGKLFPIANRWHRALHFGGTECIRLIRKVQFGGTEFTSEKILVT